jgi:NAD(P)-dependent dehydrogenase (short-subunit alcohol dehydrogenase family)
LHLLRENEVMKNFRGTTVAITGAGSGIGRALAIDLAQRGASLAISDVDDSGLAETVGLCEGHGVKVTSQHLDVADRDAMFAWADDVADQHDGVNMIVNNAGVTLGATFEGSSIDDFEWLMNINFWGVVHGTQAFLPHLRDAGSASAEHSHVVNISSVFGLVSIPGQSAYNAAKFAVRGFTDALRIELEIERAPVSTTTIHPGGIKTNIARNARLTDSIHDVGAEPSDFTTEFDKLARTTPEKAARQILKAVERNRRRALIGPDAVLFDIASRLPAGLYQRALIAAGRRELK